MKLSFERNNALPKLNLVPLDSELWNTYTGACGTVVKELRYLMLGKPRMPTPPEKLEHAIVFQTLFENLWDQLSFYPADYLAIPYLVSLLERRAEENDFQEQFDLISEMGTCLATDIPFNHTDPSLPMPTKKMINDYNDSIVILQERTKLFLEKYLERLQRLGDSEKMHFYTAVLAILGDREAAMVLTCTLLDECFVTCGECDFAKEDIQPFSVRAPDSIRPARSALGRWDGSSLEDVYVWFSNLVDLLGDKQAVKALSYYYGIYTCPKCGAKGRVMDLAKRYFFEL